jgi:hypothetical protein
MPLATDQAMLTLAGLAYRGFQDALPGEPHELIVHLHLNAYLAELQLRPQGITAVTFFI